MESIKYVQYLLTDSRDVIFMEKRGYYVAQSSLEQELGTNEKVCVCVCACR